MTHVSPDEQVRILTFCHDVLEALGMPRWELILSDEPESENYASIRYGEQRYSATLRVSKDWMSYPKREKRNTLIHEMLHLTHADLQHDTLKPLEVSRAVSQELYDLVAKTQLVGLERWVDQMAETLTQCLPVQYPRKVKGKVARA